MLGKGTGTIILGTENTDLKKKHSHRKPIIIKSPDNCPVRTVPAGNPRWESPLGRRRRIKKQANQGLL